MNALISHLRRAPGTGGSGHGDGGLIDLEGIVLAVHSELGSGVLGSHGHGQGHQRQNAEHCDLKKGNFHFLFNVTQCVFLVISMACSLSFCGKWGSLGGKILPAAAWRGMW